MKDIIGISFDTDDMDDDNAFLMMVLKEIDTNLEWKADCFTDYEDYLNSEIEGYLSINELEKVLNESKKAIFIRIMGKNKAGKPQSVETRSDFFASDYEVCVLCCDSAYYEIYSKQEETVLKIKSRVAGRCSHVEMITKQTVCRTEFMV